MPASEQTQKKSKSTSKFTKKEVLIITFIDQKFWETGSIPTNQVILDHFVNYGLGYLTEKELKKMWDKPEFRSALASRGVRVPGNDEIEGAVTPQQSLAASVMMNIHDKRSVREKLKEVGVTTQRWQGWLREPAFQNYLKKRAEALYQGADAAAYRQLVAKIEEGDFNALKLHFEMRGIHNPKVDINVNIQQVLVHVVEIVSKHVGDPEILEAIANDLEQATGLGAPQISTVASNAPVLPAQSMSAGSVFGSNSNFAVFKDEL